MYSTLYKLSVAAKSGVFDLISNFIPICTALRISRKDNAKLRPIYTKLISSNSIKTGRRMVQSLLCQSTRVRFENDVPEKQDIHLRRESQGPSLVNNRGDVGLDEPASIIIGYYEVLLNSSI